jgi:hypothetical protein
VWVAHKTKPSGARSAAGEKSLKSDLTSFYIQIKTKKKL